MSASFASPEWAAAAASHLQESAAVRAQAATWVFGPVVLEVDADPEHGFDATALRLELHEDGVRGMTATAAGDAAPAPFAIGGSLARWRAVFGGALGLVDGILESKLRVRGDLPTLARHRALLDGVAAACGEVETVWQDEQEPAAAPS